ncbi:uncharacterized protein LOC129761528 [Toxorhynchites rutilus septentrionalis]|uniref:uncharacterized protein LOC129761528 n=1 Tax=Toxorhynchites rutilus septentrionalis TaxID=329112 RepID=UPI0024793993|nr:uncharacterized protein LOC129761528 [Toxorhynchites rutilus septentrionalis]
MSIKELVDQSTGQQCRLCLHWIDDDAVSAEQMVDIFTFNNDLNASLADKIRDCLGLYIDPADTVSNICSNCAHTISFIDDFRILCHQTQKIYDSGQFRFNKVIEWQCYNNHASELRVLLRGYREWVDNIVNDTRIVDPAVICNELEDIASPEFIQIKEEQDENEPECDESLPAVKTEEDTSEPAPESTEDSNNSKPPRRRRSNKIKSPIIEDRFTTFQLKLKIAHELQEQQLDKPDLKAVSEHMNLEIHKIKQLWREMVNFYKMSKKGAYAGHQAYISRCRRCPLFITLNVIIPKYENQKPYEESNINNSKNNAMINFIVRRKSSIDQDVAIAEEIKAHPELWDLSLNCTAHGMKIAWKKVQRKLAMNIRTLRNRWRHLRDAYRAHKLRELKGTLKQEPANEKYEYLISLLQQIVGHTMSFEDPEDSGGEQNERTETPLGEDGVEEKNDDGQRLALAQEVQKYPIIWCYKHPEFLDTETRDLTFDKIAEKLSSDRETVKQEWARLKNTFRNRYLRLLKGQLRSDDALIVEPLYKVLKEMLGETTENRKNEEEDPDKKFDNETKLEFAKICYDNDILWNMKHPDYNSQDKRNAVWTLIAAQFGVTLEKIKEEWFSLRRMYRGRYLRAQRSSSKKKQSVTPEDPLLHLMKSLFEERMNSIYARKKDEQDLDGHKKATETTQVDETERKSYGTPEDRMRLLEEISAHDILWNVNNPQHTKRALYVPVFEEIAAKLGKTPSIVKEEWQRLRRVYRNRKRRNVLDLGNSNTDPLYVLLEKLLSPKPRETVDYASQSEEEAYPKRRYVGKRTFSNDGCIRIVVKGVARYVKVCELCGKQVERSNFEYHMNTHSGHTPYACSFEGCDKRYGNKTTRDRHEVLCHGEDGYLFQCDQCDRKFKQKGKYECHYAVKHKSQELPCSICGKLLPHKSILKSHMRTHIKNYECNVCGKVLQKRWTLKIHMRVHTKEKPYQCELCEQRFMLKVQLKTHLLKVHGVVLEELQAATMAIKKSLNAQNSGQYCRLCLHWIDSELCAFQLDKLNSTLADKIRDCLGLRINKDNSVNRICLNCEQTIRLIDEFRILCHQTENLYESAQYFNNDISKWQCYNEHVTELRVLVCEQLERVDSMLDEAKLEDPVVATVELDNVFYPEFIKVEEDETNDEHPEESSLVEPPLVVENDVDSNEPILGTSESPNNVKPSPIKKEISKFQLKLKIAQELQIQTSEKPDLKAVSEQFKLEMPEMRRLWVMMKHYYRLHKKRAYAEYKPSIYRCRECPLFAVMNVLVPKFDGDEPYVEPKTISGKKNDGNRISLELKVAIAEEIRMHPELWNLSLNCSTHIMNDIWKEMTGKFAMDIQTLRAHWTRLRGLYRTYRLSRLKGTQTRESKNEKYNHLISVLHEMLESWVNIPLSVGSTEDMDTPEEVEKVVEEENKEGQLQQMKQQLALAQEVRKYPIVWFYKHTDFHNTAMRDRTWEKIAENCAIDRESVKLEWARLKDMFRKRHLRLQNGQLPSDDILIDGPIYDVLYDMFLENTQLGSKDEQTTDEDSAESGNEAGNLDKKNDEETRIVFATVCYENDLLWNTKHPDYYSQHKRNEVWELMALQFGVPVKEIKYQWKALRDFYRYRQRRLQNGSIKKNDSILKTPLHQLVKSMFEEHMQVGIHRLADTTESSENCSEAHDDTLKEQHHSPKPTATDDDTQISEDVTYPKRRYTGKRRFSDVGCIKIDINGKKRYAKVCELCGKQVERSYFEYHMNGHYGLAPYACSFEGCDKRYGNKTTRDRHEVVFHGEDGYVFQCDQCDEKFKQKAKYEYHYALKHKNEKVPCNICGKVFKHKSIVRDHMRIHKTNYECHVCGKILQKKYSLDVHMRIHTNEKPYPCGLCEKRFMLKVQMKTHLLKVHGVEMEEVQVAITTIKS